MVFNKDDFDEWFKSTQQKAFDFDSSKVRRAEQLRFILQRITARMQEKDAVSEEEAQQHEREMLEKQRQFKLDNLIKRSQIPDRFKKISFKTTRRTNAINALLQNQSSFIVYGGNRRGKTYLLCLALLTAMHKGKEARYITFNRLLTEIHKAKAIYDRENDYALLSAVKYLAIDDMGITTPSQFLKPHVFDFLKSREEGAGLTTYFASRLPLGMLKAKLDEPEATPLYGLIMAITNQRIFRL